MSPTEDTPPGGPLPLTDVKVVDASTVVAGPGCARYLADFGADVIKVERPGDGDATRSLGWRDPRDGETLWWKVLGRNKRCVALDLKDPSDGDTFAALCAEADVLVENFRPGTLERLGFAPDTLWQRNPTLVITRVTGFGQDGPYAGRPGFATIAEAMSGFAAINGEPDGPPLLPPIALADEVTALAAAFSTMVALRAGVGQIVDVNLLDTMLQIMGPLPAARQLLGYVAPRLGSGIPYTVPRGTYRTSDGAWVAISTSAASVAERVLRLLGIGDDERFATNAGRVEHRAELDAVVAAWVGARPLQEVLAVFEEAHAAIAPVLGIEDLIDDPHVVARGALEELDGVLMPGPIARLSETPGRLRWAGRPLSADQGATFGGRAGPAGDE